jgi:hypothetical protein
MLANNNKKNLTNIGNCTGGGLECKIFKNTTGQNWCHLDGESVGDKMEVDNNWMRLLRGSSGTLEAQWQVNK